jgi:hypothetical protein
MSHRGLLLFTLFALVSLGAVASANPPSRIAIPPDLGKTPKVVNLDGIALDQPFHKLFRNVDMRCASSVSSTPIIEFELKQGMSKDFQVALGLGNQFGGIVVRTPDAFVWSLCAGDGALDDQEASLQPKEGWSPGVYRVYAVVLESPPTKVNLKVSFAVVPPPDSPTKLFSQRCFADYSDFRAKWAPVETRIRKTIASLAGKDFYTAYGKLRAIYMGLAKQAKDLKLDAGASFAQAVDDGIAFEIASAITKLQRDHHMGSKQTWKPTVFDRGHASTGDDAFDRVEHRHPPA